MENIIRQIADRISITAGAEEHSIEMQLHPASLGNVNILLTSSKEGIVAKFTAQNEIVKEAVESQMMTLQQKFSEQGIKVTSIEVTIASHAFEQNLQQGSDNNNAFNEQQAKKGRSLRRINLASLDDLDEEDEMSDADRIAAQMMAANGNTVDYSA
jgi:flagellar hook-length control protein FliK